LGYWKIASEIGRLGYGETTIENLCRDYPEAAAETWLRGYPETKDSRLFFDELN
jgi:hypothetical protein